MARSTPRAEPSALNETRLYARKNKKGRKAAVGRRHRTKVGDPAG